MRTRCAGRHSRCADGCRGLQRVAHSCQAHARRDARGLVHQLRRTSEIALQARCWTSDRRVGTGWRSSYAAEPRMTHWTSTQLPLLMKNIPNFHVWLRVCHPLSLLMSHRRPRTRGGHSWPPQMLDARSSCLVPSHTIRYGGAGAPGRLSGWPTAEGVVSVT